MRKENVQYTVALSAFPSFEAWGCVYMITIEAVSSGISPFLVEMRMHTLWYDVARIMNQSQESWDYLPPSKLSGQLFDLSKPQYLTWAWSVFPQLYAQNIPSSLAGGRMGRGMGRKFVIKKILEIVYIIALGITICIVCLCTQQASTDSWPNSGELYFYSGNDKYRLCFPTEIAKQKKLLRDEIVRDD